MINLPRKPIAAALSLLSLLSLSPEMIALGAPSPSLVTIQTVHVGDPGNPPDDSGYGHVPYSYEIGKYDVTIAQYVTFLNSVATTNTNAAIVNLWIPEMAGFSPMSPTKLETPGILILRSTNHTTPISYIYSAATNISWGTNSSKRPVCWVTWFDAARFVNWVNNGATNGADTETGSYTLTNFQTNGIVSRNTNAIWSIPSEDEWSKAAYYDPWRNWLNPAANRYYNFPTHNDMTPHSVNPPGTANSGNFNNLRPKGNVLTPVGAYTKSPSYYGTYDQGGLVWQWTEGVVASPYLTNRVVRGGSYSYGITPLLSGIRRDYPPGFYEDDDTGFRVTRTPALLP